MHSQVFGCSTLMMVEETPLNPGQTPKPAIVYAYIGLLKVILNLGHRFTLFPFLYQSHCLYMSLSLSSWRNIGSWRAKPFEYKFGALLLLYVLMKRIPPSHYRPQTWGSFLDNSGIIWEFLTFLALSRLCLTLQLNVKHGSVGCYQYSVNYKWPIHKSSHSVQQH